MKYQANLFGEPAASTPGGSVHVRAYTRNVGGRAVMVGEYDRDQTPGPESLSQEHLPPAPGGDYKVFIRADGSIVAVRPNENPGTLVYIPSYIWVDGQWVEDLRGEPLPLARKDRSGNTQAMADGGGGGGDGGGSGGDVGGGSGGDTGDGGGDPPDFSNPDTPQIWVEFGPPTNSPDGTPNGSPPNLLDSPDIPT